VIDASVVGAVLAGAWRRDSAVHGEAHWRAVAATGLSLADDLLGCDREVVFLFGLLHDTRRVNDQFDPDHGPRAATWARELWAVAVLPLGHERLDRLCEAIALHTRGLVTEDATIGACWDADRLHLPRVWIDPDPQRFSTRLAHGPGPLAAATELRDRPPSWDELLELVG
jgi:uncharacterized protein